MLIGFIKIICLYFIAHLVFSQEAIDGIVASVEDKIILKSDVILNMQLSGMQLSQNPVELESLYNQFLDQMINDNVLLVAAEKDTNVVIDNNMVDVRLNEYMSNLINEVGSEEELSKVFNKSIREIKYYYKDQIYDAMLREMYVYNYLGVLDVSRKEVEVFYNTYYDSLPVVPTQYDFSIIEAPVVVDKNEEIKIKNLQLDLLNKIKNGEDFSVLAEQYSDDPGTSSSGGDQGYYKKGTLFPEFEEVAFQLEINEISRPVRTPIGFHIIKLLDKKGEQIHTQHILSIVNKTAFDEKRLLVELEEIYKQTLNDPGLFDSLAVEYGNKNRNNSGVYKNVYEDKIPDDIKLILSNSEKHVLNRPAINNKGTEGIMIYLYNVKPESKPTIKNNFDEIEIYTKNKKQTDLLNKLIIKLKHKTFIRYYS